MRILLDVDRWDRASDADQDAAIAEVARRCPAFQHLSTERFTATQHRVRIESPCWACDGMGGKSPQSGNTDEPDCDVCNNEHEIKHPFESEPLSHRTAIFAHRETQLEFVLVPGRVEIAACLVGRTPHERGVPAGLRMTTAAETRHACQRAGAFDLAFENGTWTDHPFGLVGASDAKPRLASSIADLDAAQSAAFHELVDELGPIAKLPAVGWIVQIGSGTADPQMVSVYEKISFSPDGRWLATACRSEVRIWDAANGRQHSRFAADRQIATLAFSPDSVRIVVASIDRVVTYEVATGERLVPIVGAMAFIDPNKHPETHHAAAWLPNGRLLIARASARSEKQITLSLVDPDTSDVLKSTSWAFDEFPFGAGLATSADGSLAASLPHDGKIPIWDLASWRVVRRIETVRPFDIAIGGRLLFVNGKDQIWAYPLDKEGKGRKLRSTGLAAVAATADGRLAALYTKDDRGVSIFDLARRQLRPLPEKTWVPLAFSPDGTRLATGWSGGQLVIWPVARDAVG